MQQPPGITAVITKIGDPELSEKVNAYHLRILQLLLQIHPHRSVERQRSGVALTFGVKLHLQLGDKNQQHQLAHNDPQLSPPHQTGREHSRYTRW